MLNKTKISLKYKFNGLSNWIAKRGIGPFRSQRRILETSQWATREELGAIQLASLKRIVTHAYQTVPFYTRLMDDHKVNPEHIKTLTDIQRLPVLSKKMIREAEDEIISQKYSRKWLHIARTGGSTGSPMIIYRNWQSIGDEHAFVRRQWDWAGIGLKDRSAIFMSKVVADPDQKGGCLYEYIPFMRELILSTYHLSKETALDYARTIKAFNIKALVGYPSAISFLAKVCLDNGFALPMTAVLTTSEAITPDMREIISQAFECNVFDFYGSAERVCYIHTCEEGKYHIVPEYGYTELVSVEGSDKSRCKVISTGFWNFAMPLIRYDMGDIVVKSDEVCSCGRHFPVIKSIDGREGDVIHTPSGRQLGVTLVIQLLYVICGTRYIAESQMIQDALDHVRIEYVPTDKFTDQDLEAFHKLIEKYIPSELTFDFCEVEACQRTASGKLRPLVSLIN